MAKIARPEIEIEELTGEGSGILKKNALLYGKELGEHCRMYTEVVMPEGSDLAFMYMKENPKPIIFWPEPEFIMIMVRSIR